MLNPPGTEQEPSLWLCLITGEVKRYLNAELAIPFGAMEVSN
jgi:hypothetical protein